MYIKTPLTSFHQANEAISPVVTKQAVEIFQEGMIIYTSQNDFLSVLRLLENAVLF